MNIGTDLFSNERAIKISTKESRRFSKFISKNSRQSHSICSGTILLEIIIIMRQAGRKFALRFLKKELTMSLGAWIAVSAHCKDWRVYALSGCLQSCVKINTEEELSMLIRSSRGKAVPREHQIARRFLMAPY